MKVLDNKSIAPESNTNFRWLGPRGRLILNTGVWAMVAKAAAAANLFVTVPFVLHSLDAAQFGAWATLVSLIMFAGFLDFGFGNGTMNLIAAAHSRGALTEIATILREGRRALFWVSFWLTAGGLFLLPLIPWYRLLGLPEIMADRSEAAVAVVMFSVILAVPLNLANRVQLGLGRGNRAFFCQALGQVLTLAAVIGMAKTDASLPILTAAAVTTPLLASILNTILLGLDPLIRAPIKIAKRDITLAKSIRREGMLFFILQLAAALAFWADLPLISALQGPSEAGTYAIAQRLFSIIPMGLSLIWAPLWPIYRHALAAGHHDWAVSTLRYSVLFAVLLACGAALILTFGFDFLSGIWVRRPMDVSWALVAGLAVWSVIDAAGTAIATFLNAASIMRYQLILATTFAIVCFTAKVWAITYFGMQALPWVTAITYSLISLLPTIFTRQRLIKIALEKTY